MDQKGHIIDQKGLKMYENRQKMEFSDLKYLLFSGIFLSGIGGYPPPPLNGNPPAQKPLAERGGTPTPLNEKYPLSSMSRLLQCPVKNYMIPEANKCKCAFRFI